MQNLGKTAVIGCLFLGTIAWFWATPLQAQAATKGETFPLIHAGVVALRSARDELTTAPHDFGGHRAEALRAVDAALLQLQLAMRFDEGKSHPPAAEPAPAVGAPNDKSPDRVHGEKCPRIHAAIDALKSSRDELSAAPHDFGGHRADAIKALDEAVAQLRIAIEFAKTH